MGEQTADQEEIAAVVQAYVDGCSRVDVELLRSAFVDSARMYGNFDGTHYDVPIQEFFDDVAGSPAPGSGYRSHVERVDVVGDGAIAVLAEEDYQGVDYVNLFSLIKVEGRWKITCKTFVAGGGS
ncbi:MAG: nuclear transport factor 2 family protein [Actinobacteria bacterium]|nr:nuclear transport factor 2 family protein [Actinomycetota bacterium]